MYILNFHAIIIHLSFFFLLDVFQWSPTVPALGHLGPLAYLGTTLSS